ncbi:MAG: lamin tail domain-containing protein, partial [Verrucomicrobiales bacterium]
MRQPFLRIFAFMLTLLPCFGQDSAVIINEIQYHPANEVSQSEWLELRCLHGVNVDISGWRIEGGIDFTFPTGTVIPGRGTVLVAQNPAAIPGIIAFGPWTGKLDNGGEEIRLVNFNNRVMDRVNYSDDGDWPVGADGPGATLARRSETTAHSGPAAWTTSNELGGTPGSQNFRSTDSVATAGTPVPIDSAAWKYSAANTAPPANWKDPGFPENIWSTGRGIFHHGSGKIADPIPSAIQFPIGTPAAVLTDDFSGAAVDPVKWEVIDQGLESTAPSGITTAQSGGQLIISGTTTLAGWAGQSLRSVQAFSSRARVTAEVDRVSLSGTGSLRSSLWLWADASHYLHFTQGNGTSGWAFNASDVGGTGTLTPTGNGTNLGLDTATRLAHMKLIWLPGSSPGRGTIQIWRDNFLAWSHSVTNWPAQFQVLLTGQARTVGNTVTAVFDNPKVTVASPAPLQTAVTQATTHYFRNTFVYSGEPSDTTVTLWPIHDDGAVYYLNGTEIHRDNVPAGQSHGTFATTPVTDPAFPATAVTLPAGILLGGTNVLAVEVHQDSAASPDMIFGAQLMTSALPPAARLNPSLRLSEVSGAAEAIFRVELVNTSGTSLDLAGFTVQDTAGHSHTLSGMLASGAFLALDHATLGFRPLDGARLFIMRGNQFYDARTVTGRLGGLTPDGTWGYPSAPSFGSANGFILN